MYTHFTFPSLMCLLFGEVATNVHVVPIQLTSFNENKIVEILRKKNLPAL